MSLRKAYFSRFHDIEDLKIEGLGPFAHATIVLQKGKDTSLLAI